MKLSVGSLLLAGGIVLIRPACDPLDPQPLDGQRLEHQASALDEAPRSTPRSLHARHDELTRTAASFAATSDAETTPDIDELVSRLNAELERAHARESTTREQHYESAASLLSELRPLLFGSEAGRARYAELERSLDAAAPG